jgi:hypothetical protein
MLFALAAHAPASYDGAAGNLKCWAVALLCANIGVHTDPMKLTLKNILKEKVSTPLQQLYQLVEDNPLLNATKGRCMQE